MPRYKDRCLQILHFLKAKGIFRFLSLKALLWCAGVSVVAAFIAWLRIDAKRDQRRETRVRQNVDHLNAIRSKQEIDREAETQDDIALIDRLTLR